MCSCRERRSQTDGGTDRLAYLGESGRVGVPPYSAGYSSGECWSALRLFGSRAKVAGRCFAPASVGDYYWARGEWEIQRIVSGELPVWGSEYVASFS